MSESMLTFEVPMIFERATKNTYVYSCEGDEAWITTLYIKKEAFEGKAPNAISVIIAESEQ
jgi:hypothetical protein